MKKRCTKCNQSKNPEEFGQKANSKDGLNWWCKQCVREYQVLRYKSRPEKYREKSRLAMQKSRSTEAGRKRQAATAKRCWDNGRKERNKTYIRSLMENHFFVWRARQWSSKFRVRVSAGDLAKMWKDQRGLCAVSGRKLERDAHLDHIVAIACGGGHGKTNIRWLDPFVNVALGKMTDVEFVMLCQDVLSHQARIPK